MYQLSKREKFLLSILTVLASGVGIAGFMLMPALDKRLEYQQQLSSVQTTQFSMQKVFPRVDDLKAEAAKKRIMLKEEAAAFYEPMNTETVGETIVFMLDACRLYAHTMSLTEPAPMAVIGDGDGDANEGFKSGNGKEPMESDMVQVLFSSVNGEASGESGAIRSFLDSVEWNSSMQMKAFSIIKDERSEQYVLHYQIDVYMLQQIARE